MEKNLMKTILPMLLLIALLSSCTIFCKHESTQIIPMVEATCEKGGKTEGLECTVCGKILTAQQDTEPLGHTTETGICERCEKNFSNWEILEYVDEFGDSTGEQFVGNVRNVHGTFSNSATTDSLLEAFFRVDKKDISFILWEYGNYPVKNPYSKAQDYNITIKTPAGEKVSVPGIMYSGSQIIYIYDGFSFAEISKKENAKKVLKAFSENDSVTFLVKEEDRSTTSYKFTVDTTGFAEIYQLLE